MKVSKCNISNARQCCHESFLRGGCVCLFFVPHVEHLTFANLSTQCSPWVPRMLMAVEQWAPIRGFGGIHFLFSLRIVGIFWSLPKPCPASFTELLPTKAATAAAEPADSPRVPGRGLQTLTTLSTEKSPSPPSSPSSSLLPSPSSSPFSLGLSKVGSCSGNPDCAPSACR